MECMFYGRNKVLSMQNRPGGARPSNLDQHLATLYPHRIGRQVHTDRCPLGLAGAVIEPAVVMDYIVECPKHNGRFDYRTGEAKGAPVCVNLATYPVRVEGGKVLVEV